MRFPAFFSCAAYLLVQLRLQHHLREYFQLFLLLSLDVLVDEKTKDSDTDRGASRNPHHVVEGDEQVFEFMKGARGEQRH